jgi:uncharacterized protein YdgA (DUF945 family)
MSQRGILAVLILVAAAAAVPPVLGMVYERQIRDEFAVATAYPLVDVALDRYERGLYQSTGTLSFALTEEYLANLRAAARTPQAGKPPSPERQAEVERILGALTARVTAEFEVRHGPVMPGGSPGLGLAFVRVALSPADGELAEFQSRMGVPYLVKSEAVIGFDGGIEFVGDVPPMADSSGETGVRFSGLEFDGRYDPGTRALQMAFASESLEVGNDVAQLRLSGLAGQSDISLFSQYIWVGDTSLGMREMVLAGPGDTGPEKVVLKNLGLRGGVELNDARDKMSLDALYSLDSVTGIPDTELADLRFGMRFVDFDVGAYENLIRQAQRMDNSSPEAAQASLQALRPMFTELLRGSPSLEVGPIAAKWNGEPFDVDVQVGFNAGALGEAAFEQLQTNPALVLAGISASGRMDMAETIATKLMAGTIRQQLAANLPAEATVTEAQIDQAAASQAIMTIASLVQQGMIERNGTQLKSDFRFADGLLTVRGIAIPLGGP